MICLTWKWGSEEPAEALAMPSSDTLTVYSGREVLWSGDVSTELRAWGRWCALQVAHLWDCPDAVRRYIETGDATIREGAERVASDTASDTASAAASDAASAAAWAAAWSDASDAQAAELERIMRSRIARDLGLGSLPPELQSLYEGGPEERLVLRDYALRHGMDELAEVLRG